MMTMKQGQRSAIGKATTGVLGGVISLLVDLARAFVDGMRSFAEARAGVVQQPASLDDPASELFARALHENSGSAMVWLSFAAQLRNPVERQRCIDRAVQLDAMSPLVRAEVRRLQG